MKWFRNLRISLKLVIIFGIAIVPYVIMGIVTCLHSQELTKKTEKIIDLWIPAMICVDGLTISIENLRIKEYKYILSSDILGKKYMEEEIRVVDKQISEYLKKLPLLVQTGEEQEIYKEFLVVYSLHKKIWLKISALVNQNNSSLAERLLVGESRKAYQKQIILLKHLVQINQNRAILSINRIHSINVSATLVDPYQLLTIRLLIRYECKMSKICRKMINFNQNPANYDEKNREAAAAGNV